MTGAELADQLSQWLNGLAAARSAWHDRPTDRLWARYETVKCAAAEWLMATGGNAILAALRSERPAVDVGAVERATIASYNSFFESQIGCCEPSWDELPDSHKDRMRDATRAALAAAQEGAE